MESMGFEMNTIFPCVYHHATKDMFVVTHVDDFLASGAKENLKWLNERLSEDFELKGEVLGVGRYDEKRIQFLWYGQKRRRGKERDN